ncbi:elongation factor P--(R)-beta-lysine ligase [Alteromonas sp. C1M14]|uniref:elongation factor P--(R)-beta-lysine ligase n=1 Tax=Alteromonas sp. C1M14 TaxID=2841567 RepID=UPI001C096FBD|nr:elongation factor P--(R)-beta-lysine ligase [Alteromonas sp. C1M14]MBU2977569.1 elongation factor P--(R)-beta-lysine ligase [Alteromonas sp. C1M14]
MTTPSAHWMPTASLFALRQRAALLRLIRDFFAEQGVLEVETPLLSHGTVTDVHIAAFSTVFDYSEQGSQETLFLQTSPEYAMKRLLCAGSGDIYQICKAFRHEGAGRHHNPEFTLLEWYRCDYDHHQLMGDVDALLQRVLNTPQAEKISYQQVCMRELDIDPLAVSLSQLQRQAVTLGLDMASAMPDDVDTLLQLLFSLYVEPKIGQEAPCFVYGFPVNQAALARVNSEDPRTADRFEVYFKGIELANGFYELRDAGEQRKRFDQDNGLRQRQGLAPMPLDEHFLHALEEGLPACSGVAMGVDRLLMLSQGISHIDQVLAFPVSRA